MSDDLTPHDPFEHDLADRLRAAADPVDGEGVTRAGVAAAVAADRRRRLRTRGLVVGVAAAIAVVGGLAAVARTGDDGDQRITTGGTTTTLEPCPEPEPEPVVEDPLAKWFRLTSSQAEALTDEGLIDDPRAGERDHGTLVGVAGQQFLEVRAIGPIQQQRQQMLEVDRRALDDLRDEGLVTQAQEAEVAGGTVPTFTQDQVDRVLARFPDVLAMPGGGDPMIYRTDPDAPVTTSTTSVTGETPFDQWVAHLRGLGLLSPEQEAEIAAGRGITLTAEQSAAMQDYWDQQSAATSTTALSFAPGGGSTTSTEAATTAPCRPVTTTTAPLPATTAASSATTTSTTAAAETTTSTSATTTTTAVSTTTTPPSVTTTTTT